MTQPQYQFFGQEYQLEYLECPAPDHAGSTGTFDLSRTLAAIEAADTALEVLRTLLGAACALGFESITYGALFKRSQCAPLMFVATPLPLALWRQYHELGMLQHDEMIQHLARHCTPGVWRMSESAISTQYPDMASALARVWASRIFVRLSAMLEEVGVLAWNSSHAAIDVQLGDQLADILAKFGLLALHAHDRICATGVWAQRLNGDELSGTEFSERERELLVFLSKGNRVSEIAPLMGITEATVNYHIKRLKDRLYAATTAEMLARAAEIGITKPRFLNASHSFGVNLSPFAHHSKVR